MCGTHCQVSRPSPYSFPSAPLLRTEAEAAAKAAEAERAAKFVAEVGKVREWAVRSTREDRRNEQQHWR
jgi:hypothetical protein